MEFHITTAEKIPKNEKSSRNKLRRDSKMRRKERDIGFHPKIWIIHGDHESLYP